jgi:hypothetical protein
MRGMLQFRLRTLLLATGVLGGALAWFIAPAARQAAAIAEFERQNVLISTEYRGPEWLRAQLEPTHLFNRPRAAVVLVARADKHAVYFLGRDIPAAEFPEAFDVFRRDLQARMGLSHFIVANDGSLPSDVDNRLNKLQFQGLGDPSSRRVTFWQSPCAVDNFGKVLQERRKARVDAESVAASE